MHILHPFPFVLYPPEMMFAFVCTFTYRLMKFVVFILLPRCKIVLVHPEKSVSKNCLVALQKSVAGGWKTI